MEGMWGAGVASASCLPPTLTPRRGAGSSAAAWPQPFPSGSSKNPCGAASEGHTPEQPFRGHG